MTANLFKKVTSPFPGAKFVHGRKSSAEGSETGLVPQFNYNNAEKKSLFLCTVLSFFRPTHPVTN